MANDMEANLLRVRAVFHPEGPGRDVPHRSSGELFSDDIHVYFQGRSWALGGHHYGRRGLLAGEAERVAAARCTV